MRDQRVISLIERLKERTYEGGIKWETTVDDGVFQAAFPGYAVRIYKASTKVEGATGEDLILQIYNEQGTLMEEVSDADFFRTPAHSKIYDDLDQLYADARRIAMGVEDAVMKLLSILEQEG